MNHENRDQHVDRDSKGGNSAKQSNDEADAAEKLRADREKCEYRRDVHLVFEKTHGAGKSEAAEPTKHFLCSMREENDAENDAQNCGENGVASVDQFVKHKAPSAGYYLTLLHFRWEWLSRRPPLFCCSWRC